MFGPIEPQLANLHRLIYQPDPTMIGIPIGALVTDPASIQLVAHNTEVARAAKTEVSYKGIGWLAAKLETSVSISTAAFYNTRRARPSKGAKPFLGYADPVIPNGPQAFRTVVAPAWSIGIAGGADFCSGFRKALMKLPQLPEAAEEVKVVAAAVGAPGNVILGKDFTDDRVKQGGSFEGALDQYRVLYFATHGLLPQANGCLQPSLVTSQGGSTSDSLLDTSEIPNLQLDADLVVLSACDTGAGLEDGGGGAALGGLVSTFTYAGARNLLVSNWEVNSEATEILMSALFTSKAATQGDALIEAERSFMARDDFSHPYYWAAFSIVGDGARALAASRRACRRRRRGASRGRRVMAAWKRWLNADPVIDVDAREDSIRQQGGHEELREQVDHQGVAAEHLEEAGGRVRCAAFQAGNQRRQHQEVGADSQEDKAASPELLGDREPGAPG